MTEEDRLSELLATGLLDSLPEARFDRLTRLASEALGAQTSLITLVATNRQYFKSRVGFDASQTSRSVSFCDHAIRTPDQVMVVLDAAQDPRFQDNPLVTAEGGIRFYAGAPLVTATGAALGALCVIDPAPRQAFSASEIQTLKDIAQSVMTEIELTAQQQRADDLSVVVQELQHRMGNTYAHLGAMISLLEREEDDKEQLARRLREKISALSRTQSLLADGGAESVDCEQLVLAALQPFRPDDAPERLSVAFDRPYSLSGRGAFTITLVVNELATNALKHGALSGPGGRVFLTMAAASTGDDVVLDWREETGAAAPAKPSPTVAPPVSTGFGSKILTRIAPLSLGGEAALDFAAEGLRYRLAVDGRRLLSEGAPGIGRAGLIGDAASVDAVGQRS